MLVYTKCKQGQTWSYWEGSLEDLSWKTTAWVVGETNYVIYKFTFIDMNRHTECLIHIPQSSVIINQTLVELFDIRYAQNYILDEDAM